VQPEQPLPGSKHIEHPLRHLINVCCSIGDNEQAVAALEKAVAVHPQHPKAALAIGSLLQDNLDVDGALVKYRVAAGMHPDSPQVRWSCKWMPVQLRFAPRALSINQLPAKIWTRQDSPGM
jgi:tetratricopeptide (TPR) repeat protein